MNVKDYGCANIHERRADLVPLVIDVASGNDWPDRTGRGQDRLWPNNAADVPKTKAAAVLFLAELHDSSYHIAGEGIFAAAVAKLESTRGGTKGRAYPRLLAKRDVAALLLGGPEKMFPQNMPAADAEALVGRLLASVFPEPAGGDSDGKSEPDGGEGKTRFLWLAEAMLLVREHPDWSDAKIARTVEIDKSQLSRSREYRMAAALARGDKGDRHRGYQTVDPATGLHDVEAYSDDPTERDWDA